MNTLKDFKKLGIVAVLSAVVLLGLIFLLVVKTPLDGRFSDRVPRL